MFVVSYLAFLACTNSLPVIQRCVESLGPLRSALCLPITSKLAKNVWRAFLALLWLSNCQDLPVTFLAFQLVCHSPQVALHPQANRAMDSPLLFPTEFVIFADSTIGRRPFTLCSNSRQLPLAAVLYYPPHRTRL